MSEAGMVGYRVRFWREAQNLSVKQAAARVSVSETTWRSWESEASLPSATNWRKLKVTGVDLTSTFPPTDADVVTVAIGKEGDETEPCVCARDVQDEVPGWVCKPALLGNSEAGVLACLGWP